MKKATAFRHEAEKIARNWAKAQTGLHHITRQALVDAVKETLEVIAEPGKFSLVLNEHKFHTFKKVGPQRVLGLVTTLKQEMDDVEVYVRL